MSEVTRIIASDVQIKPGMWETTAAMTKSDIQELPNDSEFARTVIGKMRAQLANIPPIKSRRCLAPQNPNEPILLTMPGLDPETCEFQSFKFENGIADMVVACPASEKMNEAQMQIEAKYEPLEVTIKSTTKTSSIIDSVPHPSEVSSIITMKHIGKCAS